MAIANKNQNLNHIRSSTTVTQDAIVACVTLVQ